MRKILVLGGAAALALWAVAASADEATGTISQIDLYRNSFTVNGMYFVASPHNTVGAKLSELKNGDRVTVSYAADPAEQKWPMNAMILKRVG